MFQNHDSAELFVDLSLFRNEIIKCRLYDYSCQIKILMSQIVASRKFSLYIFATGAPLNEVVRNVSWSILSDLQNYICRHFQNDQDDKQSLK